MEAHPKHDNKKKKNSKTMSMGVGVAINIGGGSVGMGGIVVFGGALVTATIVLALKARRSSKKSRSASPETRTDQSEFTDKTNKDVSVDSQNQSDGASSIKGMPSTKSIQDLSREEKQKTDEKVESGIDIMFSVAGEDEERYDDDSVFKTGFPIVDVGKKYCIENNQQSNTRTQQQSSAPIEATEVELESMQGAVGDDEVSYEEEMPTTGHVGEETAALKVACVNQEVKLVQFNQDCEDEMSVADCEGELTSSDETGYAGDGIVSDTVCVGVEKEENGECDGEGEGGDLTDEIAMREENQQTRNKLVVTGLGLGLGLGGECDDETATEEDDRAFSDDEPATVREDNPPPPHEAEIQHVQLIEDNAPTQFTDKNKKTPEAEMMMMMMMITEGEPEENDEILIPPHALSDVTTAKAQVGSDGNGVGNWPDESMQQEADESSHKIHESMEGDETILPGNGHKGSKSLTKRGFAKGHKVHSLNIAAILSCCTCQKLVLLLILISLAIGTTLQRFLLK